MKLTPIQEKIVNANGNLIVRASAGTGKTHTMVAKITKELEENNTHKSIAAITFTIKAAREIRQRLNIDIRQQFIGTNNNFVIEEIISPFMKDVYELKHDEEFSIDYQKKIREFKEGINTMCNQHTICSYDDSKKNFIFELGKKIVEGSECCRLYLKSKYFRIYIDEYQDCDKDMHDFFMYISDKLEIPMFVVGDEKQSIYMWRGAYPKAFKNMSSKKNFQTIIMSDNFRSCLQIQNYTNMLFKETRHLYKGTEGRDRIKIILKSDGVWDKVRSLIDPTKTSALLRFRNDDTCSGAKKLSNEEIEYTFIPTIPIKDISTESSWLYFAIASHCILEKYSVYDFVYEIPVESIENDKRIPLIRKHLKNIKDNANVFSKTIFFDKVKKLAKYLDYKVKDKHIELLHETITKEMFHPAFFAENLKHVAITFHSSKGLEFDQVIIFAEDYNLSNVGSVYNHYVATSRAKSSLIIVYDGSNDSAKDYKKNISKIAEESKVDIKNIFQVIKY